MEKWNELCYTLSENISANLSEESFEQKVIHALGILGWKGFKGDLEIRTPVQFGSSNKITPDIVIKSENKNLFVIEVKKPGIPLSKAFENQLHSYMRILRLDFGILIGQKIKIFYESKIHDDPKFTLLDTIDFKMDSEKGLKFIELFSKEGYSPQKLEKYAQTRVQKLKETIIIEKLKKELLSDVYLKKIEHYVKTDLLNQYNESIAEKVLEKIKINISDNSWGTSSEFKNSTNVKNHIINGKKFNQLPHQNNAPKIYNHLNQFDLRFTKVKKGLIENEYANNWQNLLRLLIKILLQKGIPFQEIKNKSLLNIKEGNLNEYGFHLIPETNYSLQNVEANKAAAVIDHLSKVYNLKVEIEFFWKDNPNAAFPNEYCKIIN